MSISYEDIATARALILKELASEFPGVPLSIDHYILAEYRLQTLITAGLLAEPQATSTKIVQDIARRVSPT